MALSIRQSTGIGAWEVARRQHGLLTRRQLLELGLTPTAIQHRLRTGRLHPVRRGVYSVRGPWVGLHARWMAAVLSCGPTAVLSHASAAALWGLRPWTGGPIEMSVTDQVSRASEGLTVHRRKNLRPEEATRHAGIPVTSPVCTIVDMALRWGEARLETAINEADKLDLVDPEALRLALDRGVRRPGVAVVRRVLDRRTFTLTDSELERRLLPLARAAGLRKPETQAVVNGFRVDFYWRDIGLVVETDGLRYHRTPAQQGRGHLRDHAHAAAGLAPLRFSHAQVTFEPDYVRRTLAAVAIRLSSRPR